MMNPKLPQTRTTTKSFAINSFYYHFRMKFCDKACCSLEKRQKNPNPPHGTYLDIKFTKNSKKENVYIGVKIMRNFIEDFDDKTLEEIAKEIDYARTKLICFHNLKKKIDELKILSQQEKYVKDMLQELQKKYFSNGIYQKLNKTINAGKKPKITNQISLAHLL